MKIQRIRSRARINGLAVHFDEKGTGHFRVSQCMQRQGRWIESGRIETENLEEVSRFIGGGRFALYLGGYGILKRQGEAARRILALGSSTSEKYLTQECSTEGNDTCIFLCRRDVLEYILKTLNDEGLFPSSISIASPNFAQEDTNEAENLTYQLALSLINNRNAVMKNRQSRQQKAFAEMKRLAYVLFPLLGLAIILHTLSQSLAQNSLSIQSTAITPSRQGTASAPGSQITRKAIPDMIYACYPLNIHKLSINPPDRRELQKGNYEPGNHSIIEGTCKDLSEILSLHSNLMRMNSDQSIVMESLKSTAHKGLEFSMKLNSQ